MANKELFNSSAKIVKTASTRKRTTKVIIPVVNTQNEAGGFAYTRDDEYKLALYALTGTLSQTFYANAESQLDTLKELANKVSPEFIGQVAIYSRQKGYMKDTPSLLVALLSMKNVEIMKKVFPSVINNGRMIRNFVQILRSGKLGRSSLGNAPKVCVENWFKNTNPLYIFNAAVGNSPSLADVIKMVHPKPQSQQEDALYRYIIGKDGKEEHYPDFITQFEMFKKNPQLVEVPNIEFRYLTALDLDSTSWKKIAEGASWNQTRMNLNTFARHNVFNDKKLTQQIIARLINREIIERTNVFPYEILIAYMSCDSSVPKSVKDALEEAMEIVVGKMPDYRKNILIGTDVSGSMSSPVTGRQNKPSIVPCSLVAALFASIFLRSNSGNTLTLPFDTQVRHVNIKSSDSVFKNAQKLNMRGGGTDVSCVLRYANTNRLHSDLVVVLSDYESWSRPSSMGQKTPLMAEWVKFKKNNPQAKLICVDLQPYPSSQAPVGVEDIFHVGSFSDVVFDLVKDVMTEGSFGLSLVERIKEVSL